VVVRECARACVRRMLGEEGAAGGSRDALERVEGGSDFSRLSVRELLGRLFACQEARAATYAAWEAAFKGYLGAGPRGEAGYVHATRECTARFGVASADVIEVETVLRDERGLEALAGLVRDLQERERTKLQLTVASHVYRQKVLGIKARVDAGLPVDGCGHRHEGFNGAQSHAEAAGRGEDGGLVVGGVGAMEAAQEQVAEATRVMAEIVDGINEVLDELRCEMEDLE